MRKWKWIAVTAVTATVAMGCLKSESNKPCTPKTVDEEMPAMVQFATDSAINTTQDPSGILYEIIEPGDGATPSLNSKITINYVGRLLNGEVFDASKPAEPISLPLNQLIRGWQVVIPKIKKGGKVKMIIPSTLAYGCDPYYGIVANRPLYFYVELLEVQ